MVGVFVVSPHVGNQKNGTQSDKIVAEAKHVQIDEPIARRFFLEMSVFDFN